MSDPVRAIADAVLYEGYVLWPYGRSAVKNQQRFTWGGAYPRGWPEGPSRLRAELLCEGEEPRVTVTVRFLQVVERVAIDATGAEVDELVVDGERHVPWEEAVERELILDAAPGARRIEIGAGGERQDLRSRGGHAGALERRWRSLDATLQATNERLGSHLHRIAVEVTNEAEWDGGERAEVLKRSLCSTHVIARVAGGAFTSLIDPPAHLREHAEGCAGNGLWPVLAGEEGDRSTMLAAPIILEDHPRVAPESPGDLFDGGEIDQLLTLSILALPDAEKDEMRAADPRTREILERTESMSAEDLMRLHGTIRERGGLER